MTRAPGQHGRVIRGEVAGLCRVSQPQALRLPQQAVVTEFIDKPAGDVAGSNKARKAR